jgi:hypothetical protein
VDKDNATGNQKVLAPAKDSILFDATPHQDWIRVNATYK